MLRAGFGYATGKPTILRSRAAFAGYIVKVAGIASEFVDATEKEQLPLNAPPRFRRIRASKGFLVKKLKNPDITGQLFFAPVAAVSACVESELKRRAYEKISEELEREPEPATDGLLCDLDTGEIFANEPRIRKRRPGDRGGAA